MTEPLRKETVVFELDFSLVTIACRVCVIVADVLVVYVTWHATHDTSKLLSRQVSYQRKPKTFSGTLLRDGEYSTENVSASSLRQGQELSTFCRSLCLFCLFPICLSMFYRALLILNTVQLTLTVLSVSYKISSNGVSIPS